MRADQLEGTHLSAEHIGQTDRDALIAAVNAVQSTAERAALAQVVDQAVVAGTVRTGTLTIAIGQSTGTAVVPAGSTPIGAQVQQPTADGTLTSILRSNIVGTTLTVYGNANATAAVTVRYTYLAPVV